MPDRIDTTVTDDAMAPTDVREARRRELIDRLVERSLETGGAQLCICLAKPRPHQTTRSGVICFRPRPYSG